MEQDNGPGGSSTDGFPDAGSVIDLLGGIRPAAAKLHIPVTTVQGWKNRGRIPENRHAAIREIAIELGVNLDKASQASSDHRTAAEPATDKKVAPDADPAGAEMARGRDGDEPSSGISAEPSTRPTAPTKAEGQARPDRGQTGSPGNAVAWIALFVAVVTLGGMALLVYRPDLIPRPVSSGPIDAAGRAGALGTRFGNDLAALKQRVDDIAKLKGVDSGGVAQVAAQNTENRQAIAALSHSVDEVTAKITQLATELGSLSERLAAAEKQADVAGGEAAANSREAIAGLKVDLDTLHATIDKVERQQSKLSEGLSRTQLAQSRGTGRQSILLLGVGQLEAAVRSGAAYRGALERTRLIAKDADPIPETLTRLEPWAAQGVPTIAELGRRLDLLRPTLAAGPVPAEGRNFIEGVVARVKATISFRRIDAGSRSPITLAERALAEGRLSDALAATEGFGGDVEAWRNAVRARLESEQILREIHEQAVAAVGTPAENSANAVGGTGQK